jgi:eukaryotic-like serine/threonine-protein kinase
LSVDGGGAVVAATVLGRGPVAIVYAGRLAATGAEVAVKVFPDQFDRDTAARLERERRALAGASSASILRVDAVGEYSDNRSSVVTELCAGSLAGMLTRGALPVSEVLVIGAAAAGALAAAHEVGVVHGGVTPHNVLFRRSGEPVLGDFGLALRERFSRDPMHALEYTAPETLRDDLRTAASDLYGLGAVLYAMLTGAPPFPRRTGQAPGERILRVLRDPVPPIQAIPTELSDLVSLLLAKDPGDRPADAARVAAWFDHVRGGRSAAVPPALNPLAPPSAHPDTDFDSFARRPEVPAPAQAQAPPPMRPAPGRTLLYSVGGAEEKVQARRRARTKRFAVQVGVAACLAVAAGVTAALLSSGGGGAAPRDPVRTTPASAPAQSSAVPDVGLAVTAVNDLGERVELTWSAEGDLDFSVVVAGEGI